MGKRDVGKSPWLQGAALLVYRPRLGPTGVTLAVQPTDLRSSGVPTPVDERRGSWAARRLCNKELVRADILGNERTTFIVGPDGKVAEVLRRVKPAEHDELVLKALEEAGSSVV